MVRNIQKPPTSHRCYAKEIDIASLSNLTIGQVYEYTFFLASEIIFFFIFFLPEKNL